MGKTRCSAARAHSHEALLRQWEGLRADVALWPLGRRAFLGRDRDSLCVLLICVVLFSTACFYFLAELVMAAFSNAAPGIQARRRVLQRPHFLPKDKPAWAQTAHCVRIIFAPKARGGSVGHFPRLDELAS